MPRELKTGKELRDSAKRRHQRWLERQKEKGVKPTQVFLEPRTKRALRIMKEKTGKTYQQMINEAVLEMSRTPVISTDVDDSEV